MIKDLLKTIAISLMTLSLIGVTYAWTEPVSNPPAGNTKAPVTVSSDTQYKSGLFSTEYLRSYNNALLATDGGNVGIGSAGTPGAKLHITASEAGQIIDFQNPKWGLLFQRSGSNLFGFHADGDVPTLYTHTGKFALMNGNVGIGTEDTTTGGFNNKAVIKQVADANWRGLAIEGSATGGNVLSMDYLGSNTFGIYTSYRTAPGAYSDIAFGPGGSEKVRFTSTGNVGIGMADPKAKLSFGNLNDGRNTADGITWYNPSPTAYGIYRTAGAWTANTYQQLKMQFDTGIQLGAGTGVGTGYDKSYVEVVSGKGLMVTSGNVGIGTTAPGTNHLSIKGTTGFSDGINAEGGTVGIRGYASNYGVIGSYTSGTGYNGVLGQSFNSPWVSVQGAGVVGLGSSYGVYGYGASGGYDIFAGNSSGKSYFAGKVGIGTVPSYKFEVSGGTSYFNSSNPLWNAISTNGGAYIGGTIRGATYGFGGMYVHNFEGNNACVYQNPFTGFCSCPSGFTAAQITLWTWNEHNTNTFYCYK